MVAKCVPWGSASSLLAQDIMLRMPKRPRLLKKLPRRCGRNCRRPRQEQSDRSLVSGRSSYRPEEQDHPPLSQAGNKAVCATRPANQAGLYLRFHLPQTGQGCRSRHAVVRHPCHEPAPDRYPVMLQITNMPSSSWTRLDGTCPTISSSQKTSPSCHCRPNHPS